MRMIETDDLAPFGMLEGRLGAVAPQPAEPNAPMATFCFCTCSVTPTPEPAGPSRV